MLSAAAAVAWGTVLPRCRLQLCLFLSFLCFRDATLIRLRLLLLAEAVIFSGARGRAKALTVGSAVCSRDVKFCCQGIWLYYLLEDGIFLIFGIFVYSFVLRWQVTSVLERKQVCV